MDGDILGIQRKHRVQCIPEAGHTVLGQSGDQIHVYNGDAAFADDVIGGQNIRRRVGTAHGPQDLVLHRLGIDRHPVHAQILEHRHFVGGDGVRRPASTVNSASRSSSSTCRR